MATTACAGIGPDADAGTLGTLAFHRFIEEQLAHTGGNTDHTICAAYAAPPYLHVGCKGPDGNPNFHYRTAKGPSHARIVRQADGRILLEDPVTRNTWPVQIANGNVLERLLDNASGVLYLEAGPKTSSPNPPAPSPAG